MQQEETLRRRKTGLVVVLLYGFLILLALQCHKIRKLFVRLLLLSACMAIRSDNRVLVAYATTVTRLYNKSQSTRHRVLCQNAKTAPKNNKLLTKAYTTR